MRTASRVRFLIAGLAFVALPIAAHAEEATAEGLVDALNTVFGKHAGKRAAHPKGVCVKGTFSRSAEAASYSKAPHFSAKAPVPCWVASRSPAEVPMLPTTARSRRAGSR